MDWLSTANNYLFTDREGAKRSVFISANSGGKTLLLHEYDENLNEMKLVTNIELLSDEQKNNSNNYSDYLQA
jgi:hypothetical protein